MCGIAGRVNADELHAVREDALRAATRSMTHRGPDGEGYYVQGNVGLGHRRLSIVDVAGGKQPLCNEDRTVWVTFNGELYNHLELRRELEARGHTFATRSDTEVLVHGFEQWGDALPTKLRGMFAFALWDTKTKTLFMARDRMGIKPLYWTRVKRDLVFASEIKALFHFPDVTRRMDEARLPEYLALRYVPGPRTMFEGIERLPPGTSLTYRLGKVTLSPFWDIPVHASRGALPLDEREEAERFTELFQEAVRIRLMGEVPVGLFLSGGLDSTAVAWAMRQEDPAALKSFSVGFEGDSEGELAYARMAAKAIGTQHREIFVSSSLFRDSMEDLAWHLDEPNADGACIPLMHLSKRAREEVVIVLSGEGADELLGGYGIYQKMLTLERVQALGGPLVRAGAALGSRWARNAKVRKYLELAQLPLEQRYVGVGRGFSNELMVECFGPRAMRSISDLFAPLWDRTRGADPLDRMLYHDTKVWLPDDLLVKADKMTMAWAVELRVPFLDHRLLERAWTLPPRFKRRGGVGKVLLRESMTGKIPAEILHRPKKGFPVPIGRWLRTDLYGACRERLLGSTACAKGLLGVARVERLLEEHRTGRRDRTEELYALWVFEEWHRAFLSQHDVSATRNEHSLDRISSLGTPWATSPPERMALRGS